MRQGIGILINLLKEAQGTARTKYNDAAGKRTRAARVARDNAFGEFEALGFCIKKLEELLICGKPRGEASHSIIAEEEKQFNFAKPPLPSERLGVPPTCPDVDLKIAEIEKEKS